MTLEGREKRAEERDLRGREKVVDIRTLWLPSVEYREIQRGQREDDPYDSFEPCCTGEKRMRARMRCSEAIKLEVK
jgi:hypothetical protein